MNLDPELPVYPLRLPVLVTGCGRSGTHFTTRLLQALGLRVNHERLGPDGSVDWHLGVRGYRRRLGVEFDLVLHQYREPIRVIRSMQTAMPESWRFIAHWCPDVEHPDPVVRAARYWMRWNKKAAQTAAFGYPIERIGDHLGTLCELLRVPRAGRELLADAMSAVGSRAASKTYDATLTYADIERRDPATFAKLRTLAAELGYPVDRRARRSVLGNLLARVSTSA